MSEVNMPTEDPGNEVLFGNKTVAWYKWAAWFSEKIFASRSMRQLESKEQAFAILCKGEELGLPPFAAWSWIYTTKAGRLAIQSKGALAVVQSKHTFAGYREWIEDDGKPTMRACAAATRKGFPETIKEFSRADAEVAGLLRERKNQQGQTYDSTYQAYLKDMLLSRARARCLDITFAAELGGIPIEGTAEDADMMDARRLPAPRQAPKGDPLLSELGARPALAAGVILDQEAVNRLDDQARDIRLASAAPPPQEEELVIAGEPVESGPPPAALPALGKPAALGLVHKAKTTTPAGPKAGGGKCSRCEMKLNPMGGCDVCGWPGPDIR